MFVVENHLKKLIIQQHLSEHFYRFYKNDKWCCNRYIKFMKSIKSDKGLKIIKPLIDQKNSSICRVVNSETLLLNK